MFLAGFPPRAVQDTEGNPNPADLASVMHLWQASEGECIYFPVFD